MLGNKGTQGIGYALLSIWPSELVPILLQYRKNFLCRELSKLRTGRQNSRF